MAVNAGNTHYLNKTSEDNMEMEQLKKRIDDSGTVGILTAHIRDDYEPAGDMMMMTLTGSGEYVQRRVPMGSPSSQWKIFKKGFEPY
jgi:hypothetical protein